MRDLEHRCAWYPWIREVVAAISFFLEILPFNSIDSQRPKFAWQHCLGCKLAQTWTLRRNCRSALERCASHICDSDRNTWKPWIYFFLRLLSRRRVEKTAALPDKNETKVCKKSTNLSFRGRKVDGLGTSVENYSSRNRLRWFGRYRDNCSRSSIHKCTILTGSNLVRPKIFNNNRLNQISWQPKAAALHLSNIFFVTKSSKTPHRMLATVSQAPLRVHVSQADVRLLWWMCTLWGRVCGV